MEQKTYRAVAFDLDGTLLDTLEDLANATNEALGSAGYPQHPVASYRQFVGSGLKTLVQRALPPEEAQRLPSEQLETLIRRTGENYARDWAATTRPYPGIERLIRELGLRKVPLAVVTNKPHDWTLKMLSHFFPENPFREIQGAMPELPHKPDPTGALGVAQRLGIAPGDIAFVGDSDIDMLTARNAGMGAFGVAWGFRGAKELQKAGADRIISNPLEIMELFARV